jgi:N-acyl-phosphatidylethanolamine-hydrolysing phospholipase D
MDHQQHPSVLTLPAPASFVPSHHGPFKIINKGKNIALTPEPILPKYFINPWPSYRMATLTDAWTAYQKGAVIAPRHGSSRPASRSSSRARLTRDFPSDDEGSDEDLQNEDVLEAGGSGSGGVNGWKYWKTRSVYVRPEFERMHEEDEMDDWRDPPVEVIRPGWEEMEGDKEDVTWLGHAGVLVRIPWKGSERGRKGMCGVLFDPIFSYRYVVGRPV